MTCNTAEYQPEHLAGVLERVLNAARQRGATAAEAGVSMESGLNVTVRMGSVETVEHNRDKGLGITVYFQGRKGSSSTTDFSDSALDEAVAAACSIASRTMEDNCAHLADADLMATDIPELDLCHPWDIDVQHAIDLATRCEDTARQQDSRIQNSDGATVSSHQTYRMYANSHGFIGGYPSTRHSVSCVVIAREGGNMQRDFWYDVARDSQSLEDVESIGKTAALRTVRRLNGRRISTCQVPVIYSAEVASSLMNHFVSAIRGSNLYRKSSFLLDHLGKQVFPEHIEILERPHLLRAMGSAPFDNEGVRTCDRTLIDKGILQGYVLGSYSACQLGMQTTGNAGGVHNLIVSPEDKSLKDLLSLMGNGLLITELMGQGVNTVTGDYSRGAAGFWIENGEISYPVEEITVAGNLRDMFRKIVHVGNDVETRRNIRTGSILIDSMTVAGD